MLLTGTLLLLETGKISLFARLFGVSHLACLDQLNVNRNDEQILSFHVPFHPSWVLEMLRWGESSHLGFLRENNTQACSPLTRAGHTTERQMINDSQLVRC